MFNRNDQKGPAPQIGSRPQKGGNECPDDRNPVPEKDMAECEENGICQNACSLPLKKRAVSVKEKNSVDDLLRHDRKYWIGDHDDRPARIVVPKDCKGVLWFGEDGIQR